MTGSGSPWLFGEVLFDHFPDGRRVLGGAPFNVTWHLQAFGAGPRLVSRLGEDAEGAAVRSAMEDWSLHTGTLQRDPDLPTGQVRISIENDEPSYDIVHPVAWDRIEAPRAAAIAGSLLYHGSLALRDPVSLAALQSLRAALDCTVFLDVNLRPPWYRVEQVLEWVRTAHWAKLNEDEFVELAAAAALPGAADPLPRRAARFLETFGLTGLIVTRGGAGALLLTGDGMSLEAAAAPNREPLVDTVGAGDAFSSVLILGLLRGWAPEHGLDRALEFAAAICGQRGATVSDPDFYARYRRQWGLDGLGFEHV